MLFHPLWFVEQDLLAEEDVPSLRDPTHPDDPGVDEGDEPSRLVTTPDYSAFDMTWGQVIVTLDQFQVRTSQIPDAPLARDLVIGAFTYLSHSPVEALAFTRSIHAPMAKVDAWESVSATLTPQCDWMESLEQPRTESITVVSNNGSEHEGGFIVTIESSNFLTNGLYVHLADSFERGDADRPAGADWAVDLINDEYRHSEQRADKVQRAVLGYAR